MANLKQDNACDLYLEYHELMDTITDNVKSFVDRANIYLESRTSFEKDDIMLARKLQNIINIKH